MRYFWGRLIGRRYGPVNRVLCYRAHWFAKWEPVRLVIHPGEFYVSEEVLEDLRRQSEAE